MVERITEKFNNAILILSIDYNYKPLANLCNVVYATMGLTFLIV
jgi:hypothetical protein